MNQEVTAGIPESLGGVDVAATGRAAAEAVAPANIRAAGRTDAGPTAPEPTRSPLDPRILAELRAIRPTTDGDVLTRVLGMYAATAPALVDELRAAVAGAEAAAMQRAAHSLRSSSAHIGATRLAALSTELEAIGQARATGDARTVVARLDSAFAEVQAAVAALLDAAGESSRAAAT